MGEDGSNKQGQVHRNGDSSTPNFDDSGYLLWRVHQSGFGYFKLIPFRGDMPLGWERGKISLEITESNLGKEIQFSMFGQASPRDKHPQWYKIVIPPKGGVQFLESGELVRSRDKVAWIVGFAIRFTQNLRIENVASYPALKRFTITIAHRIWLKAMTALVTREDVRRLNSRSSSSKRKAAAKAAAQK